MWVLKDGDRVVEIGVGGVECFCRENLLSEFFVKNRGWVVPGSARVRVSGGRDDSELTGAGGGTAGRCGGAAGLAALFPSGSAA